MLTAVSFGAWGRNPIFNVHPGCEPNFITIKKRKDVNSNEETDIFLQY